MEYYNEYSNTNSMNHTSKFYYVKKLTQIILSMSLFSLLISQSSLAPIIVNSYDYFVPRISIKLFTCTTERNCIFLLCNGILVLIIQTSGLISKITPVQSSAKGNGIDDHRAENIGNGPEFQEHKTTYVRKFDVTEEEEREIVAAEVDSKEDYESVGINIQEWDYDDNDEEQEEEEDQEEGIDELNKKCEDFIKKVKQEIQGTSK